MKYRKRIYYTEEQRALMWDRWQRGDSLHEIARLFDRHHASVRGILERSGGIRPAVRRRSGRSLTLVEREEISRGIVAGRSLRAIALRLGRSPSTFSRELSRNGGRAGYRATRLMRPLGIRHGDRSAVNWRLIVRCHGSWPGSCRGSCTSH